MELKNFLINDFNERCVKHKHIRKLYFKKYATIMINKENIFLEYDGDIIYDFKNYQEDFIRFLGFEIITKYDLDISDDEFKVIYSDGSEKICNINNIREMFEL